MVDCGASRGWQQGENISMDMVTSFKKGIKFLTVNLRVDYNRDMFSLCLIQVKEGYYAGNVP